MMTSPWDNSIFEDFRKGKLEAFYKKSYPGLVLYAIGLLGQQKGYLAEDCVQESVYKTWRRRTDFDSVYTFKAFLYTSIKNGILDIHRKDSAREHYVNQLGDAAFFTNTLIDQEAQTFLYNAINDLPGKMREVFELSFIEGLRTSEIAARLGLTDSSIRKYRAGAIDILRSRLPQNLFSFLFSGIL